MKKSLLLLLFLPLFSFGQNWHGVPVGQHNIFRVSVPGVDSFWNNYIRNIYVDNVITAFNGTQYNFYKSIRKDHNEILDTTSGPTWLGHSVFRENNGDEIFLNKYLDTIRIKTLAGLTQSWTLGYDTTNTKYYIATVTNLDTLTIDGSLDSIKTIEIQAYINNTATTSIYNNYEIILSKKHGFHKVFDFYGFPNYEQASLIPAYAANMDLFPTLPYLHIKLDSSITQTDLWSHDLQFQYQPGNSWMIKSSTPNSVPISYYFDSIISVYHINADTAIITGKRESISWTYVQANPSWISNFNTLNYTDTVYRISNSFRLHSDVLEDLPYSPIMSINTTPWTFLDPYCSNRYIYRDTVAKNHPSSVSGYYYNSRRIHNGLNIYIHYINNYSGGPNGYIVSSEFVYYNFNGCTYGTYTPLRPVATLDYNLERKLNIYPNPTTSHFYLEQDIDWQKIEVISPQGQVVKLFSKEGLNTLDIQDLPTGLYLLKISTAEGNYIQKLVKK